MAYEGVGVINKEPLQDHSSNVTNCQQEGDYHEGDVDQEGMDIEYFSQYKERDEFDGRTGMFQVAEKRRDNVNSCLLLKQGESTSCQSRKVLN